MAALSILTTTSATPPPAISAGGPWNFNVLVDFSKVANGVGPAGTDTIDFAWVPAGYRVTRVVTKVEKAAGGVCTVAIGDEDDSNCFIPTADANAAVGTRVETTPLYSGASPTIAPVEGSAGKSYPAAKKLRMLVNNANAVAQIRVGVTLEPLPL
jgi:hypothetical protein